MRLLVTGASGFIGRRVVQSARDCGFSVIGTTRSSSAETVTADVTDPSTFEGLRAAGPFDAVVHCAGIAHKSGGIPDEEYFGTNTVGTRNIAQFAAEGGATKFIILSTVMVYGQYGNGIDENEACRPQDAYATSKFEAEQAAVEVGARAGMAVTVLRPAPVIGEGCKGNFARLVRAVERGHFINVGDGSARKSMIYVGDVAGACIQMLRRQNTSPQVFNLAGEVVTTGDLLRAVCKVLGKNYPRVSLPARPLRSILNGLTMATKLYAFRAAARSLETWTSDAVYSSEAIKKSVGFMAETPVNEAIRRTVASYKATNPT